MFFFFLAGHALADYPLQTGPMPTCKCRKANDPIQKQVAWYYWMSSHAMIHGGVVAAIVKWFGYPIETVILFGVFETVIHFLIDFGKCERWYGMAVDQSLHLLCKIMWWLLLIKVFVP